MQYDPNQWQQPPPQQPPGWGQPPQAPPPPQYAPAVPLPPAGSEPAVSPFTAIKFIFQDEEWKSNLLIGAVFTIIPVLGQIALQGWMAEILQRLARKHQRPIPKLDFGDLMHYFSRGVAPFVVTFLMMLPMMFIFGVMWALATIGGGAAAAATNEPIVALIVLIFVGLLGMLLSLAMGVFFQAGMTRAELTEDIGGSISPGALFSYVGKIWGKMLVAQMLYGLMIFPLIILGYAMCIVGLYPMIVIINTGGAHLRSQLYDLYLSRGGEPIPVKGPVQIPSETPPQPPPQQGYYQQPPYGR